VAYAVGLSLNRESLKDQPDANTIADNVFGAGAQSAVDASRYSQAVFGELLLPLSSGLEAQVALRHDWYNRLKASIDDNAVSYGGIGKTSPKLALRYLPMKQVLLRASYAESFAAPTLKQLFGGTDESFDNTSEQAVCDAFPSLSGGGCSSFPYIKVTRSNPRLRPETGKTANLGLVLEPTPAFSLGIDYFVIRKKDEITRPTVLAAVAAGATAIQSGEAVVFTDATNLAQSRVSGIDVDLRARLGSVPWGKMTLRDTLTYYRHIRQQPGAGDPFDEFVGTFGFPRWRNNVSLNLENGSWSTTANVHMVSQMVDSDLPRNLEDPNVRTISAHQELDLLTAYTGIKTLRLTGGIKNVLDRAPPYSNTGTQSGYGALGFSSIYSPRGRFFFVAASCSFR